jgi:hypothetical protein
VKGRLNELWALIGALGAELKKVVSTGAGGEWAVVAGRAAAFDEDSAEGSERFECCFWEIEYEYDAGGCWICAGGWG